MPPATSSASSNTGTRSPRARPQAPPGRSAALLAPRLQAITRVSALPPDAALLPPTARLGHALVAPLRVPVQAIADVATAMAQRAQGPPDFPGFDALPGAGAVFAPRLLVACGEPRERSPSADARQQAAGIAPVTERRGKHSWGPWRGQCPQVLRPTGGPWAAESLHQACWVRGYSPQPRDKGKAHPAAVRALAFKGLRLLFRGGQERTP
jgi:hypothetical protein